MRMFYINLASRQDRRKKMDKFKDIERVEAVKPSDLLDLNVKLDLRSLNNLKFKSKSAHMDLESLGAVCCFLSHRKIWEKMHDENIEDAVILEDDVDIKSFEFPQVDLKNPFVWLGLRSSEKIQTRNGNIVYDRKIYGSHAYRIHISLIPRFLYLSETLSLSLDFFINEALSFLEIETKYKQLVDTTYEIVTSPDIQHVPLIFHKPNWHLYVIIFLLVCFCIYKTK